MESVFDIDAQISCVKREISMRKAFYSSYVARGKMTEGTAEKEIKCMEQVLNTLVLAKRAHLDKSWNQPAPVQSWLAYPEHQPQPEDRYNYFLVAYINPRYIEKSGLSFNSCKHLIEVSQWIGNDFLPSFKNKITHYMPLPQAPEE